MPELNSAALQLSLQSCQEPILAQLRAVFIQNAIENQGLMRSPRRAPQVARQLYELLLNFTGNNDARNNETLATVTQQLAEQGLAITSAAAMVRVLAAGDWLETLATAGLEQGAYRLLADFQLRFLEKLVEMRESVQKQRQEQTQGALQKALHGQLEQQQRLQLTQQRHSERLSRILHLNANLATVSHKERLLAEAVYGFQQALELDDVTLYLCQDEENSWLTHTSTDRNSPAGNRASSEIMALINRAQKESGAIVASQPFLASGDLTRAVAVFQAGKENLAAIVVTAVTAEAAEDILLFIRTFSQNLSALWRTLELLEETSVRTRELEILHGRYVDNIWQTSAGTLYANYDRAGLHVERNVPAASPAAPQRQIPLLLGDHPFGNLSLPEEIKLGSEETEFVHTLLRETGNALNNAYLFAQVQGSLNEMSRLYRAGREISQAKDAQTVYDILVNYAAESGIVDMAHIVTSDSKSPDYLIVPALWDRKGTQVDLARDRIHRDKFIIGDLLAQDRIILIHDGQVDEILDRQSRILLKRKRMRACALLPLFDENQWLATLALYRHKAQPPAEQELQSLQTLCDQASIILANQRLLAETNTLYRVGRALNEAISLEDIQFIAVEEIVRHTAVDQCRIILYDKTHGHGYITAEYEESDLAKTVTLPMAGNFIYDQLDKLRQPLLFEATADGPQAESANLLLKPFNIKASLLIPAISQQELIGFIALDTYSSKHQFTPANIKFAQAIADQFTTTAESLKLFDEALRRAQELITLNQIGAHISGTLDLNELAKVVHEQTALILDSTIFLLALYDAASHQYQPLLYNENGETWELEPRTLSFNDPMYHFLQAGQPLMAVLPSPLVIKERQRMQGSSQVPQSSLWVPLMQESAPIGLLSVQSYKLHAYKENDIQLLRSIATQAGLAVSNAKLFRETQENIAELRLLFSITQAAASSVDFGERVENTIDALHNSLGGADVAILLVNEAAGQLETLTARGLSTAVPVLSLTEGLVGQVVSLAQPLMVNDLQELPDYLDEGRGILSQLVVPLNLGRRTVGVINVESRQANAFAERDLRLLQTLSVSLASAIESGRLFQEIQSANEQLRELDRLKTQFLANMSHELRTPLNSIIGFSRVILKGIDGPITSDQEEDLTSIHNSGQHLLRLINDILDLAKIEAGKMALAHETVDLEDTAQSVLSTVRGLVKDRPIKLIWKVEAGLPLIEADPIRLRQILLNFLSNAVKFTEKGQVKLDIFRKGAHHVGINIADTGLGIDPKDYEKLFTAFEQVDSSPTRAIGGTGLGLPITRRLIELHQGVIEFESEVGRGTTFYVTLPLRQNDEAPFPDGNESPAEAKEAASSDKGPAEPAGATASFTGARGNSDGRRNNERNGYKTAILIVDDEPGVVSLYERYLRNQPYRLISVYSGLEALSEVANYRQQIAAILLDINMPDIDGWDVLKVIRDNPETSGIPVIICSIDNNYDKASALGAQLLLPKPIVEEDLLNALKQIKIKR
jgi:signal transduction histidine kinase